jgi:hypothetical protein
MSWDVYFPYVQTLFNDDGTIVTEKADLYERSVGKLFHELVWFADWLKLARQSVGE